MTKLKNSVVTVVVVTFFCKINLTPQKSIRFLRAAFRDLAIFFLTYGMHESYSSRSPIMYDLVCTAWSQVDANSMTLINKCFGTTNKIARV